METILEGPPPPRNKWEGAGDYMKVADETPPGDRGHGFQLPPGDWSGDRPTVWELLGGWLCCHVLGKMHPPFWS